jgi:prokaryotic ubiquitin-like protein Pup
MATRDSGRDAGGGQSRASRQSEDVEEVSTETESDVQERVGKLTDDVDSLLDEIDDVLEENAEDFIKGYVQKGGE